MLTLILALTMVTIALNYMKVIIIQVLMVGIYGKESSSNPCPLS